MANPDPEIPLRVAKAARPDAIVATGRSDFPNQVNNVLGFPFIFRGALDVRATQINEEMKIAAAQRAGRAGREDVPGCGGQGLRPGAAAVRAGLHHPQAVRPARADVGGAGRGEAAMETGVARMPVDLDEYREQLEARLGKSARSDAHHVQQGPAPTPSGVVLPEGEHEKMIRAARQTRRGGDRRCPSCSGDRVSDPGAARTTAPGPGRRRDRGPGRRRRAWSATPRSSFELRAAQGRHPHEAGELIADPNYFAAVMVQLGDADAMLSGADLALPGHPAPAAASHPPRAGCHVAAGVYMVTMRNRRAASSPTPR